MIFRAYHCALVLGGIVLVMILSYYLSFPFDPKSIVAYLRAKN